MIPKVIRLDLAYRDYSNHRECKAYEFSNVQGLTEDSIIAAFEKIGHRDIIPYQFGLPCDLAPTLHPDEQTYDGDHCYIEITQLYMTDNVKPQQHLLHCDISDIVDAINQGGSEEWFTLEKNIKADKIAAAKKLLLDEGYTVSSPEHEITVSLSDEVKGDDIAATLNTKSNLGLAISFDGYSDCCSEDNLGTPLYIEKYDGKLRVLVYADINSEEPSHVIDLSGAQNNRRNGEQK